MKRLFALAMTALVATAPLAAPGVAQAQPNGRPGFGPDRGDEARGGRQVPLSRVLAMLASRYPGRHLNTTTGDAGGRPAYFVQWQMENGQVVVFVVAADSGQVIGRQ
ncbi:MAG: hypothetical protein DI570_25025 [Phenylobacterium zucineum]|nr:MAG: hypothetical protein DI570_25025 [Phenylobacterium zucineum]